MNNSERRLHDVEERLEGFEAPDPPERLLETIHTEIPTDLGSSSESPASAGAGFGWRKMAASLAVVTVGGVLGYTLLREGPSPGEVATSVESPSGLVFPAQPEQSRELGEALRPSPEVELPERRDSEGAEAVAQNQRASVGKEDDADASGAGTTDVAASESALYSNLPSEEGRRELGEAKDPWGVVNQVPGDLVDRINVGQNESGQPSTFSEPAANSRVARQNEQVKDLRAQNRALQTELQSVEYRIPSAEPEEGEVPKPTAKTKAREGAVEESLTVTAESPSVEPVKVSQGAPMAPPARAPDWEQGDEGLRAMRRAPAMPEPPPAPAVLMPAPAPPSTGGTAEPNDEAYGDMFFQAYGTNPFIDTEDDAQSTFGIDVDTASYTMARSYLERGSLPPADAIRVEEFINYFDYGDAAPRRKDFAVVAEGAPSPFSSTARTHLVRFALKGREIERSQRKPAVLTFVVDISGSMNRENRLGLVKRALRLLVDQLDSGDSIGLVVYGSSGRVVLEPTSDHRRVMSAIDHLRPGGSTNAEEGLVLGYRTARRFFRSGSINRVILCSDGVANVGRTGPDSILARIAGEADQGIELTTVGFGMGNYNDVLMEQLADKGDGNYAYVDDLDAARRVFVENLTGTLETIAGDAKIQVEFDPQVVQSYRLLGYENRDIADRDFRNDAVDAGEIGGGHQVTALYEVKLRADVAKSGKVATLRLRYKSKRSGRVVEDSVDFLQADLASRWNQASRGLQLAATVAEFAEIMKGSYWAREGDLRGLARRARDLGRLGSWDSDLAGLAEMIERAAQLRDGWPASREEDGEDGIER